MTREQILQAAYNRGFEKGAQEATGANPFTRFQPTQPGALPNAVTSLVNAFQALRRGVGMSGLGRAERIVADGINLANRGPTFKATPGNNVAIPALGGAAIAALLTDKKPTEKRVVTRPDGSREEVDIDEADSDHTGRRLVNALLGGALGYTASKGYYHG